MSENVEDFPLGPPPSYETTQKVNNNTDLEKQDIVNHFIEISDYFEFEDPPPYKEKESSRVCEDTSGFQFVFPLITRPWKRFFTVCLRGQCNLAPENFGQNMTYYQLNYSWILLIVVIVAVVVTDSEDLNFCVLWTSFSVLLIYVLNMVGFCPITLLGQKLSLSEQLTALVMFQLPFYGLLSGAVPLIFYIAPFAFFVMIHACFTPVNKAVTWISKIHHI